MFRIKNLWYLTLSKKLKIIDPYDIKLRDYPVFIQAGDMRSFLGWGIKMRTKSNFNHSMVSRKIGYVCSQSWTYKEIPIERYMKPYIILKFWTCKDMTDEEYKQIYDKIVRDLSLPWWKRMYDFPGIIGQAIGLRWINIPGLKYCSERVSSKVRILIPTLGKHPTPEDIDTAFKKSPRFECIGYWLDTKA